MVAEAVEVIQTTEVLLKTMVELEAVELEEIMVTMLQLELQTLEAVEVVEVVHQLHPIETEPMVGLVFAFLEWPHPFIRVLHLVVLQFQTLG